MPASAPVDVPRSAPHASLDMLDDRGCDVDARCLLQSLPSRDAVDFEHEERPIARGQHVDTGIVGAHSRSGGEGDPFDLGVTRDRGRRATDGDIRAPLPCRRPPLDRANHSTADDEDSKVAAAMIDRALHVEHGLDLLQRADDAQSGFRIAHSHHPVTERAEDRLDDDVTHRADGGHRLLGALADHGLGHEQAGIVKQGRRVELVH